MWVVIMLVVAVGAGVAAYWASLATLPDEDHLGESGIRVGAGEGWRRLLERARRIPGGLRTTARRLRPLGARVRASAVQLGLAGDPLPPSPSAGDRALHGQRPRPPVAPQPNTPAAPAAPLGSTAPAPASAPLGSPAPGRAPLLPPAAANPPRASVALTPPQRRARPDARRTRAHERFDSDGVLFVPVARDAPDAHSRLVAFLGIVALVTVAGGLLALGVWQSVHFIARAVQHLSGS